MAGPGDSGSWTLGVCRVDSRKPFANGLLAIFSLVICAEKGKIISIQIMSADLLVLVSGDGGEDSLGEGEGGGQGGAGGEGGDVHHGLVPVHRVQTHLRMRIQAAVSNT